MPSTIGIVASAFAGFDPLSIAGCRVYLDSAASPITASGSPLKVSQWNDLSGTGNHVAQATAARQPSTGVDTKNGLNVLTFASVNYLAGNLASTIAQPHTVFAVAQNGGGIGHLLDSTSGDWELGTKATSGYIKIYAGGANVVETTQSWATWRQVTGVYSGASSKIYVDGVDGASGDATHPGTGSMTTQLHIGSYIGDPANSLYAWIGCLAALLVYDTALSTANRQAVQAWMKARWGTP